MDKAKKIKIFIKICDIIFGLLLLPWIAIFFASIMMFDSSGADDSIYTIMLFRSVVSFPFLVIASKFISRIAYKNDKYNTALLIALSPLLSLVFFALAWYLMDTVCDGKFAC